MEEAFVIMSASVIPFYVFVHFLTKTTDQIKQNNIERTNKCINGITIIDILIVAAPIITNASSIITPIGIKVSLIPCHL